MRRLLVLVLVVVGLVLAGCGSDGIPKVAADAEDLCAGLSAFKDPKDLMSETVDQYGTERAAQIAYGWVRGSCPDLLKWSDPLRAYLVAGGVDPDQ